MRGNILNVSSFYRGYPPEYIPGQSSVLENRENLSPHWIPNQSAVTLTMEGGEGEII